MDLQELRISFKDIFDLPKSKRANKLVNKLRNMYKTKKQPVKISNKLNEFIWDKGRENVPRKLSLLVSKEKDLIYLFLETERKEAEKMLADKKKKAEKEKVKKGEKTKVSKEEKKEAADQEKKIEEKQALEKDFAKTAMK
ncbi:MAG: hypothetical protein COT15_02390 [Candidatus Diapherotrites archaeon CG08_land_8_20_14_0_20_34_12]|nr:MAG: hypothetical protein COT15_02390 [Candidatus Diapherotrites archaeon CG08_land_8_20_14_0_20_34_12]